MNIHEWFQVLYYADEYFWLISKCVVLLLNIHDCFHMPYSANEYWYLNQVHLKSSLTCLRLDPGIGIRQRLKDWIMSWTLTALRTLSRFRWKSSTRILEVVSPFWRGWGIRRTVHQATTRSRSCVTQMEKVVIVIVFSTFLQRPETVVVLEQGSQVEALVKSLCPCLCSATRLPEKQWWCYIGLFINRS